MLNYGLIVKHITPNPELVTLYNLFAETPIKKFTDRITAEKRTAKILEDNDIKFDMIKNNVSNDIKNNLEKIAHKIEIKFPGPKGKFNGKKLYKKVKNNPRRPGTHGHRSFELIEDGMTYEEFRGVGGRTNDLNWDVDRGKIEAR